MQATNNFSQQDTASTLRDLIQVAPNEFDTVNHARALQVATGKDDDDDEPQRVELGGEWRDERPPSAITKLMRGSFGGRP